MKKLRNLGNKVLSCFMIIILLQMFFEVSTIPVVGIWYGNPYRGVKYTDTTLDSNGKIIEVERKYYDGDLCLTPQGDTLNPSKYHKSDKDYPIYDVSGFDSLIIWSSCVDSWMRTDTNFRKIIVNGRYPCTSRADNHAVRIKLKKITEFKGEHFAILPLLASRDKKDYFSIMRSIGQYVDEVIAGYNLPVYAQSIYNKRLNTPRLRPFMSYLSYSMAGGQDEKLAKELAAISETTNLHLYCHNYLLDNKKMDINDNRSLALISAGQYFADLTHKIIINSSLNDTTKLAIIGYLAKKIDQTYEGHNIDARLTLDNYPKNEDAYFNLYYKRCDLMSGSMYDFSLWLGYAATGENRRTSFAAEAGQSIGHSLQIVNDIADFSPIKSDYLADWRMKKVTMPLYCLLQEQPDITINENNISQAIAGCYDYSIELSQVIAKRAKIKMKMLDDGVEKKLLRQILAITQDNKYFRNLKQLKTT